MIRLKKAELTTKSYVVMNKQERNNKIIDLEMQIAVLKEEIRILANDIKSMEKNMLILQQVEGRNDVDNRLLQDTTKMLSNWNWQLDSKKQTYNSLELEIKQLKQKNGQIHPIIGYFLFVSIFIIPYFLFKYLPEWIFLIVGRFALLFCGRSGSNRPDKGAFND